MSAPPEGSGNPPLSGVRVLDLGQIYQGPYAGYLLALAGADVVKVEPPGGEPMRRDEVAGGPPVLPMAMLNGNKRTLALDLKSERGKELLIAMAREADVLLENFAPGVLDRLGVGADVLRAANPALIYASGTGYGLSGPDRDNLAMDVVVQAVSGIMSVTGPPEGPPYKAGPAVCDFISGIHLYAGIVTALYDRTRTGTGQVVEVAMIETIYPTLTTNLRGLFESGGEQALRTGNRHSSLSTAPYNVYPAKDGSVAINCVTDAHWRNLARAMGREELADDPRFVDRPARGRNIDAVDAIVEAWTSTLGKQAICDMFREHHIPGAPVRELPEIVADPHMHERGMLQEIDHPQMGPVTLAHSPIRYHGSERIPLTPSQPLGANSREVLVDWLGLPDAELNALAEQGVIREGAED
jgi:crotonobetainyl-CoA:carnitine CoA-transferase CaiB-like acyl-CoA transferase